MLDVGAAASRISRVAKMHFGDRVQCSVVEPGEGWVEYYRHHHIRLAGHFFPIAGDETWDYIHTSHWLEHVEKLDVVIKGLRSSLRKGGLCFIEVPNCDIAYFTHDFPDQPHVHFFTAASLRQAMQTHGFVAVDVRECAMANAAYLNYRRRPESVTAEERRLAQESEASTDPVASGNLLRGLFRAA
ncbi:MAG: Methyltransferase domain-containing protein [Verrucomicrobia bacterium]|nr:MAG: Methyltransferase domain-containing protein [Verrucomicrobiota bacterium]